MLSLHRILHPTDFSPRSDYAFHLACDLARDHGADLVVMHVMPEPVFVLRNGVVTSDPPEYRVQLEKKLRQIEPPDLHTPVERVLVEGDPVREILRSARERRIDLIVMGTHGWTGLSRFLMGSVAENVVRMARCAVMTVKMPLVPEPVAAPAAAEPAKT
jgi:nucleotide-binding universal stress UspA family protein